MDYLDNTYICSCSIGGKRTSALVWRVSRTIVWLLLSVCIANFVTSVFSAAYTTCFVELSYHTQFSYCKTVYNKTFPGKKSTRSTVHFTWRTKIFYNEYLRVQRNQQQAVSAMPPWLVAMATRVCLSPNKPLSAPGQTAHANVATSPLRPLYNVGVARRSPRWDKNLRRKYIPLTPCFWWWSYTGIYSWVTGGPDGDLCPTGDLIYG